MAFERCAAAAERARGEERRVQPLSSIPLGPLSCRCTAVVEMWKERVRAFEAIVHTLHLMLTHAAINSDAVGEGRTAAQARRLSSHRPPPYLRPPRSAPLSPRVDPASAERYAPTL